MVNYRKIIQEDVKTMETLAYKANPKTWPEEWAEIKANDTEARLKEEKLKNRYEIFQSFYPVGSIIICTIVAVMIGFLTRMVLVGVLSFLGMVAAVVLFYSSYYHGLEKRIESLKNARNEYYRKYGRKVIKELLEKYRYSEELPEKPKIRLNCGEQLNFADLSYRREELYEPSESSKKENVGFDLHLVGDANEINGDFIPGDPEIPDGGKEAASAEAEEEAPTIWRRSGEPVQPRLPAEAELQPAEPVGETEADAEVKAEPAEPVGETEAGPDDEAEAEIPDGAEFSEAPSDDVADEAHQTEENSAEEVSENSVEEVSENSVEKLSENSAEEEVAEEPIASPEEKGGDTPVEEIPIFDTLDEFIAYFGR